jgi:hypothetical protein
MAWLVPAILILCYMIAKELWRRPIRRLRAFAGGGGFEDDENLSLSVPIKAIPLSDAGDDRSPPPLPPPQSVNEATEMKDAAELYKRSEDDKLIECADLKTVVNDYLTMSSSTQRDYYIKFHGKTYENAKAVKKLRDTIEHEDSFTNDWTKIPAAPACRRSHRELLSPWRQEIGRHVAMGRLTWDEAWRIAANIAKLPDLMRAVSTWVFINPISKKKPRASTPARSRLLVPQLRHARTGATQPNRLEGHFLARSI